MAEEFDVTHGRFNDDRSSLGARILQAWGDMRTSTRRVIDEDPSEARLLFYVLLSDIITFLSWTLKSVVVPSSEAATRLPVAISLYLILMLMGRTASMYVFAGAAGAVCRLFGGSARWRDTRAGVFWGALVAAPFGLVMALVSVGMSLLEDRIPVLGTETLVIAPYWLSMLPFVWFISAGLAEAQRFERVGYIFFTLTMLTILALVAALYLSATGVLPA